MNKQELRKAVRALGMTARTDGEEIRINFPGGSEATAYYTNDCDDALATARAMRERSNAETAAAAPAIGAAIEKLARQASKRSKPPTVAAYFQAKLGQELELPEGFDAKHISSPAHVDFHIKTGCGVECKAAIDAAAGLMEHVRKAYGNDRPEMLIDICMLANDVVNCYVYG